ncbi:hypothetical protein BDV95DRAFT_569465 [Massariosphaeria phaeospora]|uniref:Uncharacterized protein n=1 Tax=Massariosphaeria phaeospora TaxID=100035 RepID=A0A7C8M9C1_9PLEO|nr:hypothetical protein BDV95DRAFT_569465 [Massariosphaeria phaeospora]
MHFTPNNHELSLLPPLEPASPLSTVAGEYLLPTVTCGACGQHHGVEVGDVSGGLRRKAGPVAAWNLCRTGRRRSGEELPRLHR